MFEDSLNEMVKNDMRCIVGRWLDTLEPEENKLVHSAVSEHSVHTTFRAAKNYTYQGSQAMWYKHWNRLCVCSTKS
jgi:hypothetical protein